MLHYFLELGGKHKENHSANDSLHFEGFYCTSGNTDCGLIMVTLVVSVHIITVSIFLKRQVFIRTL